MKSILVVDDEAAMRSTIIDTLQSQGYTTLEAAGGTQGVQLAKAELPDVIICDYAMPDLDGVGVLAELRSDPRTATLPFIFLTGRSQRADMRRGMAMGADDYITKPFGIQELIDAVQAQLKKQQSIAVRYETTMRLLRKNIIYALPHELRTPLMGVMGFAELLSVDADELDGDNIRAMSGHILKSAKRLQRVIENYLVYAQIELIANDSEQMNALHNHIVTNTAFIIADQSKTLAEEYNRHNDLILDLSAGAIQISEVDLRKIIEELVDNAFKFSPRDTKVHVKTIFEQGCYKLWIRDFGQGMTAEQIKSTGAYMQFERALHEQQGLGLGFIIAQRLVELHKGTMDIQSKPEKGTLVIIQFPA